MGKKISIIMYRKRKLETYHFTKLLYYFLRHNTDRVCFEKLHGGVLGYYDYGTDEITLDYRKEIVPTLVHEFIHRLNPHLSETKVIQKEKSIMAVLSHRQCMNILKALAKCI